MVQGGPATKINQFLDVKQLLIEIENVNTVSRNRFSTHWPALLFLLTGLISAGAMRSKDTLPVAATFQTDFISNFIPVFGYLMLP